MPQFDTTRRVGHSASQMFDLVADVEAYPAFVPLCLDLNVRRRAPGEGGAEIVVAQMEVGYKAIRETFTSRVTLDKPRLEILVEYIDGPFEHLRNRWSFHDVAGGGSEVRFFIDYKFRSRALSLLMGSMFDAAFRRFAGAFEKRANEVYGAPPRPGGARS